MKHVLLFVSVVICTSLFANTTKHDHSTIVSKLQQAWKKSQSMMANEKNKETFLIVYTGQDITSYPNQSA